MNGKRARAERRTAALAGTREERRRTGTSPGRENTALRLILRAIVLAHGTAAGKLFIPAEAMERASTLRTFHVDPVAGDPETLIGAGALVTIELDGG